MEVTFGVKPEVNLDLNMITNKKKGSILFLFFVFVIKKVSQQKSSKLRNLGGTF